MPKAPPKPTTESRAKKSLWMLIAAVLIAGVYLGSIVYFAQVKSLASWQDPLRIENDGVHPAMAWKAPSLGDLPGTDEAMTLNGAESQAQTDSIRRGALLFNETSLYAQSNSRARLSCASCHAEGGVQPYAAPMVDLPRRFPLFNPRAGRVISLKDRIEECFVRSQNGDPIDLNGTMMRAYLDYINWLSTPQPGRRMFEGRGLVVLPKLKPDSGHGQAIYATQCAGCHGEHGEGRLPMFPPLWGPASFNDGAGMHDVYKMAAFVQHNMPQNRMGSLTPQEAYDVSAYIHLQPRPAFNPAYKGY